MVPGDNGGPDGREPAGTEQYLEAGTSVPDHASLSSRAANAYDDTVALSATDDQSASGVAANAPQRVGDYEILNEIARGGMGIVYRARHQRLGRVAAIKLIKTGDLADEDEVRRFHAEAEAAAQLDHPHIVQVYEVGRHHSQYFMALALVDGPSLWSRVKDRPLPPMEAARLMHQVCRAVQYAHDRGIVHRDIKPHNILVTSDGQAKLTDFGLAKRQAVDSSLTATGQAIGTPSFMPPEQAAGSRDQIGPLSDVYSLGATLYCLVTGRPPFQAASAVQTLQQVLELEPVKPRVLNPSLPRDLETICLKCLQKPTHLRYPTAGKMADDLDRFMQGEPILARPVGRVERAVRWCRRRPLAAALCASLLVIAIVSAGAIAAGRQARQVKLQFQRANELAARQLELDNQLDQPKLSSDYLLSVTLLTSRIGELSASHGLEARKRVQRRYTDYLGELIRQPRLSDEDSASIQRALDQFATIDPPAARRLATELQQRSQRWTELFRLSPPFDNVNVIFPATTLRLEAGRLTPAAESAAEDAPRWVHTMQDSRGEIEFEATFDQGWRQSRWLALAVDAPANEEASNSGYQFVLQAMDSESQATAAAQAQAQFDTADLASLEIRSQNETLQRRFVPMSELRNHDSVRLYAARRDGHLVFRVNDLAPLETEDLFPVRSSIERVLAVGDMRGPHLSKFVLAELTARSRKAAARPSPLAAGDDLFVRNEFRQALEQYRLQRQTAEAPREQHEASFKSAMCLAALQRESEAIEIFNEVLANGEPPWSTRAGCQLWLLYLEAGKVTEADDVMVHLSATHKFEDLAASVPLATQDRIMQNIIAVTKRPGAETQRLIRNLERLIDTLELLGAHEKRIYSTRIDLLSAYELNDEADRAYVVSKQLIASPAFPAVTDLYNIHEDYARLALAFNESEEAIATIDGLVFEGPERHVRLGRAVMLVTRASLNCGSGKWEQARDDLQLFFAQREHVEGAGENISAAYQEAFPLASLLLGLVHEELGDSAKAKEAWQVGFHYAREHNFPDHNCWESGALGSLSGELTEQDVENMVGKLSELPAVLRTALRNRVVPISLLTSVTRNVWHQPQGRAALRQACWGPGFKAKSNLGMIGAMLHEIGRELILGMDNSTAELSPEQAELVEEVVRELVLAFQHGELSETHVIQTLMTYHGNVGVLGFAGLMPRIPANIRAASAYIFACHYSNNGNLGGARTLLDTAAEHMPTNGPLPALVQDLRGKLDEPTQ